MELIFKGIFLNSIDTYFSGILLYEGWSDENYNVFYVLDTPIEEVFDFRLVLEKGVKLTYINSEEDAKKAEEWYESLVNSV
jgi:hypothetical protein